MVSRLRSSRLHYAWVVAAVTFLTLLGASGFRSTPGVLIAPLQQEFGWNRAVISLAVSINLVLFGLSGPFAAALTERFGLRRVVVIALLCVAAGSSSPSSCVHPGNWTSSGVSWLVRVLA